MKYNLQTDNRRTVRLSNYDYSQEGAYFITICCYQRANLFGEIIKGEMILNANGNIAYNEWLKTIEIRSNVELDVFIIMPNHIHGIIIINNGDKISTDVNCRGVLHTPFSTLHMPDMVTDKCCNKPNVLDTRESMLHSSIIKQGVCNTPLRSPSNNVGAIVRGYKSAVTKQMNILGSDIYDQSSMVWQRNYYEHIIRNEKSYQNIADYIVNNPAKWDADRFHKKAKCNTQNSDTSRK